jgi:hypothetical protein
VKESAVQRLIALTLVLTGTNLCTYAYTRYSTTRHVLTKAQVAAERLLKAEGIWSELGAPAENVSDERYMRAKAMMGDIICAGGM